jgi:hypothetical protein
VLPRGQNAQIREPLLHRLAGQARRQCLFPKPAHDLDAARTVLQVLLHQRRRALVELLARQALQFRDGGTG